MASGSAEFQAASLSFVCSFTFLCVCSHVFLSFSNVSDIVLFSLLALLPVFLSAGFFQNLYKVALCASSLGSVASLGLCVAVSLENTAVRPFGWYLLVMCVFHCSEYICTALTSPTTLCLDSFLLNHSKEYWIAAVCSWTEFFLELLLLPEMKRISSVTALGLVLCVVGESLRKSAMLTARANFTHIISFSRKSDHELVTHGIYSLFRHPSYVGWFWWSVGTQLVLCNPLCFVAYGVVSWRFFKERIYDEEILLINFFGVDYIQYKERVPTGLPFIDGFKPDQHML